MADLKEYISKLAEDVNVILYFYEPKNGGAEPRRKGLMDAMGGEYLTIFTVTVAQIDRTKANKDILEKYNAKDTDCIVAIDKTKEGYPAKKRETSFMTFKIKNLVENHKY